MNCIYFDNAATTRPTPEVCEAVSLAMRERYGNPSSLHGMGSDAERAVGEARAAVARALGAGSERIAFTSGGTESNNLAILGSVGGIGRANGPRGRAVRALTTRAEHPSVLEPYKELRRLGWQIDYFPVKSSGVIDLDALESALDGDVALISLTHVNNETGVVQPVAEASALRYRKCPEALLHVDCVQSFGKLPFSPAGCGMDIVSVSAHKIHGPKGVGAIYFSGGAHIKPLMAGGGQEGGLRSGTENVPGIAGFGVAARDAAAGISENAAHAAELGRRIIDGVKNSGIEYTLISDVDLCSPYILNISFPGVRAEVLLNHLSRERVYVSSGSACSSRLREKQGSHVLQAMGINRRVADGAVRFSFSRLNTLREAEDAVGILTDVISQIRK